MTEICRREPFVIVAVYRKDGVSDILILICKVMLSLLCATFRLLEPLETDSSEIIKKKLLTWLPKMKNVNSIIEDVTGKKISVYTSTICIMSGVLRNVYTL